MIDPAFFVNAAQQNGIEFYTGIPDSLLKELCTCISQVTNTEQHQIAANEGGAIGLAIGHYLASRNPALVYMQNSGLGNSVNPIASLASSEVYGIPMLLVIGWRGEVLADGQQLKDEPQHVQQGKITLKQLDVLGITYSTLSERTTNEECETLLKSLVKLAKQDQRPVALLIRKNTFTKFPISKIESEPKFPSRELAIQTIVRHAKSNSPIIATTGMASRELYETRKHNKEGHERDFLTVGGMGHAIQIATGIARSAPNLKVICIDGDGAMLMHAGSLAISAMCQNLIHIVINNGAHDSVGGQPTPTTKSSLSAVAKGFGYQNIARADTLLKLEAALQHANKASGSCFIEMHCRRGAREDLGRPAESPKQNKITFMDFLSS